MKLIYTAPGIIRIIKRHEKKTEWKLTKRNGTENKKSHKIKPVKNMKKANNFFLLKSFIFQNVSDWWEKWRSISVRKRGRLLRKADTKI